MVSLQAIWQKKRYARDPEYRERRRAENRHWRAAHKDELNQRNRTRFRTDPRYRKRRRGYRFHRYGMSGEDYDALVALQGGLCAICRRKPKRSRKNHKRRLEVDHCHSTNKVRGLLCGNCNTTLGQCDDDTERLLAAIAYLVASRHDVGPAEARAIAAEFAERSRRRLEVLIRAAFALRRRLIARMSAAKSGSSRRASAGP
jgi:Autographiviridae endonuclease VII